MAETVNKVWELYDVDGNGFLDKQETFKFVLDNIQQMGMEPSVLTEEVFEATFSEYDYDQTGKISRNEMAAYLRKVMSDHNV